MKEKIFKKGLSVRILSLVVALAMVITLMPMNSMKVYAWDVKNCELSEFVFDENDENNLHSLRIKYTLPSASTSWGSRECYVGLQTKKFDDTMTDLKQDTASFHHDRTPDAVLANTKQGSFKITYGVTAYSKTSFTAFGGNRNVNTVVEMPSGTSLIPGTEYYLYMWTMGGCDVSTCPNGGNNEIYPDAYLGKIEINNPGEVEYTDSQGYSQTFSEHVWEYTVPTLDTIKAHCKTNGHGAEEDVILTLVASSSNYTGSTGCDISKTTLFPATLFAEFNTKTGNNLSASNVKIYSYENNTKGDEVTGNITTNGKYLAELSVPSAPVVFTKMDGEGRLSTANLGTATEWTYNDTIYEVYNGFIPSTSYSSWNDAMEFVAKLNNANYDGHNDWTLLSSKDMATAWYSQYSTEGRGGVDVLWSSVEDKESDFLAYYYDSNSTSEEWRWDSYLKDYAESYIGFVILRPAGASSSPVATTTFEVKQNHTHGSWTYEENENILTATCGVSGDGIEACGLENNSVTLTISARDVTYSGSAAAPTITYGTSDEQTAWTDAGLVLPDSTGEGAPTVTKTYYSTDESGEKSGEGSATAPTDVGTYVVEIKISCGEGKEATVLLPYNVNKAAGAEASSEGTTVAGGQKTVTISGMKEGQEYIVSTKAEASSLTEVDWSTPVGADGIAADLADETTYYVYTRVKETDNSNAGKAVLIASASTNVAAPADNKTGYTVSDDMITVADGYEVFADENCTEPIVTGTTLIPGTTYYVRKAGKEGFRPSEALSFTYNPRTVTYDLNKGTGAQPAPQTVESGSLIDAPVFAEGAPVKGSLSFQGWYKDRACTEAWDFEKDQLTEDITLYAGYAYDAGNNEEKAEMSVVEVEDCIYNGKAHKPVVIVKHDGEILTLNKDYTVSYKNNTNANPVDSEEGKLITGGIDDKFDEKLPTIIIKGKGNYQSEVKMNFNIIPYALDAKDVVYSVTDYVIAKTNAVTAVKASLSAGSKKLKAGKDYDAVLSNTDAAYPGLKVPKGETGVYSLTITGKGNYTGTLYSVITIAGAGDILEMNKAKIKLDKIAYEGKAITAEGIKDKINSVKIGKTILDKNDYEVTLNVDSITSEGRYVATIEGKNPAKVIGSKTVVITVNGVAISKAKVGFKTNTEFDNSNHGSNGMEVEINSKPLVEGTDYIVKSIKNDLKAGKATVEIEGKGIYKGIKRNTYTIYPRELSTEGDFTVAVENQKYQKSGAMPDVDISYKGVKLTKGTDYTLSYKDNKKTGIGCVTVTGKGNYKGQIKNLEYTIEAASFEESGVTVQAKDVVYNTKKPAKYQSVPVVYDGNGKKLTANKDYSKTVKYYSYDGEFDGDYSSSALAAHKGAELKVDSEPEARSRIIVEVTEVAGGNYTRSVYGTYRVTANSISKAKIEFNPQMYTGKEIKLAAKDVKEAVINRTTPLKLGEDFEIVEGSYANNIKTGTAKVTVRGLDNYGGTKVVKFKITSKNIEWWKKNLPQ